MVASLEKVDGHLSGYIIMMIQIHKYDRVLATPNTSRPHKYKHLRGCSFYSDHLK